eukprot:CAMPEP_0178817308 /NCGR_PEP_ID=MMETSP0746-20121128/1820_1 /TAXON_ID=913974 /ORGANISM="Nitzschia punctata, Strain CCMP561" /LENGTH=136 /DNA_ID=CAMNT_0020478399 /DNA_START=36 /DNA_END=446 /DNA_ORIENTATION=+
MVDEPYDFNEDLNKKFCYTGHPMSECQDCQRTPIHNIFTAHFTSSCGKPEHCEPDHDVSLCVDLLQKWHNIRHSLEEEWKKKYDASKYNPKSFTIDESSESSEEEDLMHIFHGHCHEAGRLGYIPMEFPNVTDQLI